VLGEFLQERMMEVHKVVSSDTAAVLSPTAVGNQAGFFPIRR